MVVLGIVVASAYIFLNISFLPTSGANDGFWKEHNTCPEKRMRICGLFLKVETDAIAQDSSMNGGMFACCRLPLNAILVATGKNIVLLSIHGVQRIYICSKYIVRRWLYII